MIIVLRRLAFVCFRFLKENVHSFSSYSRSSQDFSKLFCFVVCSENFRPNWILVRLHISRPLVCMRGCMIQHCLQACLCTLWNVYSLKYLNKDNSRSFWLFELNVREWSADTNWTTAHNCFMLKSIMAFPILCKSGGIMWISAEKSESKILFYQLDCTYLTSGAHRCLR